MTNPKSKIQTPKSNEWLEIGTIVAPQGLSGEIRVNPDTDFPERFEVPGQRWLLHPGNTEPKSIELLAGRYIPGKNLYVIKLAGVEDRNSAEELRDCKLMVQASDRPQLEEDEYHVLDLIGLSVFMQESGELVGTVIDVISAGNDLLEVQLHQGEEEERGINLEPKSDLPLEKVATRANPKAPRQQRKPPTNLPHNPKSPKTVLIPFVKAIAPVVDLESNRIEITPPEGLLELNNS
ncbi:MAG: ribosome maturation factor RimM [Rhizonema sp. PD38]|nr:ribosome maturation factor RimM [Rhizonema sp. PD38]